MANFHLSVMCPFRVVGMGAVVEPHGVVVATAVWTALTVGVGAVAQEIWVLVDRDHVRAVEGRLNDDLLVEATDGGLGEHTALWPERTSPSSVSGTWASSSSRPSRTMRNSSVPAPMI